LPTMKQSSEVFVIATSEWTLITIPIYLFWSHSKIILNVGVVALWWQHHKRNSLHHCGVQSLTLFSIWSFHYANVERDNAQ
jgi:hypothetical protein